MKFLRTFSSLETRRVGERFARRVLAGQKRKGAAVAALSGPLGAGKTAFIQGFFRGLDLKKRAASPTFIVMRRVGLKKKHFKNVFHIDAYRLKNSGALLKLGFRDIAAKPENIILVEWADKIRQIIPRSAIWVKISHGDKENERNIVIK